MMAEECVHFSWGVEEPIQTSLYKTEAEKLSIQDTGKETIQSAPRDTHQLSKLCSQDTVISTIKMVQSI